MELDAEDLRNSSVVASVSPTTEELLRGLVTLEWKDEELPAVLKAFAKLSKNRRRGSADTGEYLDVQARTGRVPKIVVMDEGRPRSTGIDAVSGQAPESNALALAKLAAYQPARAFLEKEAAKRDPLGFKINYALRRFVEAREPAKNTPDRKKKLRSWKRLKLAVDHLMEFFEGKPLRFINLETGRDYYAFRMGQELRKGKRDPENLKDSPIRKELYLLNAAVRWFIATRRIETRPVEFEMPDFIERETPFYSYAEFMRLLWACLGYDFETGGRVKIEPATSRWLIRFFVLYFFTGTRYDANGKLVWGFNDFVGCIDHENGVIWRNGANAPKSKTKPKRRSDLIPLMQRIARRWFKVDTRLAKERNVPLLYVIHENGRPPRNFTDKVNDALDRSGTQKSAHKCKHGGVTLLAYAGYTDEEIAEWFGNAADTLRRHYKHVDWKKIGKLRDTRKPIESFVWKNLRGASSNVLSPDQLVMLKADLRAKGQL